MKTLPTFLSALALFCAAGGALAGEYKLPDETPLVSITFPKGWNVEAQDDEIIAMSEDEEIEIDFWVVDPEEMKEDAKGTLEAMGQEIGALVDEYLVDLKTEKPVEASHNGLTVYDVEGKAKDSETGDPVNFSVTLLTPDNKQIFVMLYWGSDAAEKANADDLKSIIESMKKL